MRQIIEKYQQYFRISFIISSWFLFSGLSAIATSCAIEAGLKVAVAGIEAAAPYAKKAFSQLTESEKQDNTKSEQNLMVQSSSDLDNSVTSEVVCFRAIHGQWGTWEDTSSGNYNFVIEAKRRRISQGKCIEYSNNYRTENNISVISIEPYAKLSTEKAHKNVTTTCPNSPTADSKLIQRWNKCFGKDLGAGGVIYEGEWDKGKKNGHGTITFSSSSSFFGDKYMGEFKYGEKYGKGEYIFANGNKYVGNFYRNKFYGEGQLSYASGDKYVGEWIDGKKHGKGTITYADGEIYKGGFKNGMYHGKGEVISTDGRVLKGIWENDKFTSERK